MTLGLWLEWASARLLALPSARIKPQGPHVIWPEYSQNTFELLEFRAAIRARAAAPSADEIPVMDEILLLPNAIPLAGPTFELMRRTVRLRSLVHPVSNRHLYNWDRIAGELAIKQYTSKRLYHAGLERIVSLASQDRVGRIAAFFRESR